MERSLAGGEAAGQAEHWVGVVRGIKQFRNKDRRAPYKPLLLLWLIGRTARRESTRVQFADAEEELKRLMSPYRLADRVRVEHPFVYLATSRELWSVNSSKGDDVSKMPQREKESPVFLREHEATGELTPEFELALQDPHVRSQVVNALLGMEFPESTHEEILESVGLSRFVAPTPQRRDPRFKDKVLLAYEQRCSFCGFGGRMHGTPLGIDAAHVQMRSHHGPDSIDNGVALCVMHHRLFDRGALGLDEDLRILVSQHMMSREEESPVPIKQLVGTQMRLPQPGYAAPAAPFVRWHRRNLFIGPQRQPAE